MNFETVSEVTNRSLKSTIEGYDIVFTFKTQGDAKPNNVEASLMPLTANSKVKKEWGSLAVVYREGTISTSCTNCPPDKYPAALIAGIIEGIKQIVG